VDEWSSGGIPPHGWKTEKKGTAGVNPRGSMLYHEKKALSRGAKAVAGADEAGVGSWAGPVVAGCVCLRNLSFVNEVNDSKKLTPAKREKAFSEILKNAYVGIGIVDVETIDEINIFEATRLAMEKAIKSLKVGPEIVLVDGRVKPEGKFKRKNIIDGDCKSLSIAAASIIAKVSRDRIMRELDKVYPGYGFAQHKGYGTKQHLRALRKLGPSPVHRKSFKPVSNLS